ncbi:PfkB family carbohydrate kinase [Glutamicibacter sp.]|uniref:PfkB family carbohydrate kinase n=1 Tax=Glutamicibacter sp. TaxID=1931995 RepID=UPI002B497E05|nr:PfkB family carbohydrate kinase [Glutamicibacter sp.]HJX79687.1 PfkB family carbohydrate kinase [Glutamicibacter sp.]
MNGFELDVRPVAAVVLSSQLAYGAVGNNVIARMIERAGHRTVAVPTVLLSNLPHYPTVSGGAISDQWLSGILADLLERGALVQARYVVVGYLGSPSQARIIAEWFVTARARYPQLRLILDTAFGDSDVGLYASEEVAASYGEYLIEHTWLMTPNAFELELLTESKIHDEQDAANAALDLMDAGPAHVIVTSAPTEDSDFIGCLLALDEEQFEQFDTGRIATEAKGAGDCFLGILTGALLSDVALPEAAAQAVAGTSDALSGVHPAFSVQRTG